MTVESFIIKIQQTGAEAAARSIQGIEASAHKTASTLAFFRQALVALSAVRVVETFTDFADSATRIDNRLRVATKSSEDFARAQKFVYQISRDTRTEVEANAVTYSRLLRSTEGLGFKTNELEKAMEGLSYAVKVGGATSQEARNSLIQFSQSLASGALRGDELRSVSEQLPALANAIGKEFGVAGGQLLAFAKANPGILETDKVLRGVIKAADDLKRQAAGMSLTIGESFVVLSNSVKQFIGEANSAFSILGIISRTVLFVADNLNVLITTLVAVGATLAAINFATLVTNLIAANNVIINLVTSLRLVTAAQTLWNAAMLANPIGAIVLAVGAFVAALVLAYQYVPGVATVVNYMWGVFLRGVEIVLAVVSTLAGPLMAAWNLVSTAFSAAIQTVQALWEAFMNLIQPLVAMVAPFVSSANASTAFNFAISALLAPLKVFAEILPYIVTAALYPLVAALDATVKVLASFGLVSRETAVHVREATSGFFEQANTLFTLDSVMGSIKNIVGLNSGEQINLAEQIKKANAALKKQLELGNGLAGNHANQVSKMEAVNAKYEALYGKSENLNNSTKRLSSSTSSLGSALTATAPKTEEMAMGTDQMSMSMVNGANSANQLSTSLNGVSVSAGRALKSMEEYIRSGIFSGKDQFSSGVKITSAPLTGAAKTITDMGGTYAFQGLNSGAVSAKVTDSRTGNTFSQTGITKGSLDAAFTKWLAQQDKIVANMNKAAENLKTTSGTTNTVKPGSLGGGAMNMNTAALDRNTKALTSSSQDYMDLVDKLYNKLDLARQNVSGGYTDPSSVLNSSIAGVSKLPGYASGVDGVFSGAGGTDNNLFMARVSKGEGVKITPKNEMRKGGGGSTINVTINATDADSIVRNEAQVRKTIARAVASAQRAGRA